MSCRDCPDQRGQSTVEFALVLPILLVVVLGILQVGAIVSAEIRLVHLCRMATRAAAVSGEPSVAARLVVERFTDHDDVKVQVTTGDDTVTVVVRQNLRTDVAIVGDLVPDVTLEESLTMLVDP